MEESKVPTADVMSLLDMIERKVLSMRLAKGVLEIMAEEGKTPDEVISEVAMPGKPPSKEHIALVMALVVALLEQHAHLERSHIFPLVTKYTAGNANLMAIGIVCDELGKA